MGLTQRLQARERQMDRSQPMFALPPPVSGFAKMLDDSGANWPMIGGGEQCDQAVFERRRQDGSRKVFDRRQDRFRAQDEAFGLEGQGRVNRGGRLTGSPLLLQSVSQQ
jgi:hypothetical protein